MSKVHLDFSAEEIAQSNDVCRIIFQREKAQVACRLFIEWLKKKPDHWGSKRDVREFGAKLDKGVVWRRRRFRYSQRNFYMVILRNLIRLGLISKEKTRWHKKSGRNLRGYGPTSMPRPKSPPEGGGFYRNCWCIAELWQNEFD